MSLPHMLCRSRTFAFLTSTLLVGCVSWHVQTVAPEQLLATEHPSSVRVTQKGGYRFVLDSPRISGDSLVGAANGQPSGVPLANIAELESRRSDGVKSVGLTLGVVAVLAMVFFGAVIIAMGSGS